MVANYLIASKGRLAAVILTCAVSIYCITALTTYRIDDNIFYLLGIWGIVILASSLRDSLSTAEIWVFAAFIVFVVTAIPAYLINEITEDSSNRMFRIARFLLYIPLYFLMRRYASFATLYLSAMLGAVALGLWALTESYQLVSIDYDNMSLRVSGTTNAIQFGNFSLLMIIILLVGFSYYSGRSVLIGLGILLAMVLALFGFISSGSRSGILAMPLLLLIWCLNINVNPKSIRNGIVAIALIASVIFIDPNRSYTFSRYSIVFTDAARMLNGVDQVDASLGWRISMWKSAWMIAMDNPAFGSGIESYEKETIGLVRQGRMPADTVVFPHPHNEYLSVFSGRGMFGLLGLFGLFGVPIIVFYHVMKSKLKYCDAQRRAALVGVLFVVAYAQFSMFETILDHRIASNSYVLLLALIMALVLKRTSSSNVTVNQA